MAENKTRPTEIKVGDFIAAVPNERRRADAKTVCTMMEMLAGEPPRMWGPSIIGFGSCHYRHESGREGDMPRVAFSPRSTSLVLYLEDGFPDHAELKARLGKHKTGKCCLYINKLADVDEAVLEELTRASLAWTDRKYPRSG